MRSFPSLALSLVLLAGCAEMRTPPGATYERIQNELKQAAEARPTPREAAAPAPAAPAPPVPRLPEHRFNLAVNNGPASQVFMAMVNDTRYSMLVHPDVSGTVTVNLKDVTLREALDTLRELYGYEYRVQGNRIMILPNTLQTRVFTVNYLAGRRQGLTDVRITSGSITTGPSGVAAGAVPGMPLPVPTGNGAGHAPESSRVSTTSDADFWGDVASSLKTIVGTEGGRSVVLNPVSGVVVVRGMPPEMRQVEEFLRATRLVIERQVMLEAKILEVQLNDGFQSGINWSYFNHGNHRLSVGSDTRNIGLPGGALVSDSANGPTIGNTLGSGLASAAGRTAGGLFGLALQTTNFAALLQFLETQGSVQVLSSPRIATMNNQKAVLKVGTDEFFVTNVSTTTNTSGSSTTTSPTITVQPFFSGIALDVTPQIDESANIILHIHPSISAVTDKEKQINLGTLGNFTLPLASSNVNETDSMVRVQDGNIVAIGGLMKQQQSTDRSQIPMAGDIPGLGYFFGQRSKAYSKQEIVILLKPTVIQGEAGWQQGLEEVQGRLPGYDPQALR